MNFPQKNSKQEKGTVLKYLAPLWRKKFLLIFIPFYWFDTKIVVQKIQIFLRICPFPNMVRKTNFLQTMRFCCFEAFLGKFIENFSF